MGRCESTLASILNCAFRGSSGGAQKDNYNYCHRRSINRREPIHCLPLLFRKNLRSYTPPLAASTMLRALYFRGSSSDQSLEDDPNLPNCRELGPDTVGRFAHHYRDGIGQVLYRHYDSRVSRTHQTDRLGCIECLRSARRTRRCKTSSGWRNLTELSSTTHIRWLSPRPLQLSIKQPSLPCQRLSFCCLYSRHSPLVITVLYLGVRPGIDTRRLSGEPNLSASSCKSPFFSLTLSLICKICVRITRTG